jgi:hypothetical protein
MKSSWGKGARLPGFSGAGRRLPVKRQKQRRPPRKAAATTARVRRGLDAGGAGRRRICSRGVADVVSRNWLPTSAMRTSLIHTSWRSHCGRGIPRSCNNTWGRRCAALRTYPPRPARTRPPTQRGYPATGKTGRGADGVANSVLRANRERCGSWEECVWRGKKNR